MKQLLFMVVMLISGLSFAQTTDSTTVLVQQPVTIDTSEKSLETTVSELISDTAEGMKTLGRSTKEVFFEAVDIVVEQGTIIITQYIIYTSIKLFLPMLISLIAFFIVKRKLLPLFTTTLPNYNKSLRKYEDDNYSEAWEKPIVKNYKYFNNQFSFLLYNLIKYTNIVVLIGVIYKYLLPWIKVTFMPKLYLFEMVMEKIL